uniref:Helix-turn-helix transcriptional regulator n=1 Tax=Yoonia rhodophyticola TaxID=3137370 RepID=A0AAN0NK29_9RHOB
MKLLGDSHLPSRRLTGARIRERRLDLGLRQSAVAQEVGISPSYLNLIEHNRRRDRRQVIARSGKCVAC